MNCALIAGVVALRDREQRASSYVSAELAVVVLQCDFDYAEITGVVAPRDRERSGSSCCEAVRGALDVVVLRGAG